MEPAPSPLPRLLVLALVALAAVALVPFVPWMVMALWLGIFAQRVQRPLARKLGDRPNLAASLTVLLLLLLAVPVAAVIALLTADAIGLVERLLDSREAFSAFSGLVQDHPTATTAREALRDTAGIFELVAGQGERALAILRSVAGATAHAAIGLLILVTGMYGVMTEGSTWYEWAAKHVPMTREQLDRFRAAFLETGRGLWWGIGGAGFLQAVIATIAYLVLGVPSALPLGLLTLVFSVIPAIGTAIIWVPVAVGLYVVGQPGAAIALAVIGVAVIGSVDNLARPWLARRGALALPSWLVMVAMFGGIAVIGGWGILLGPLAVRLAKEALVLSSPRLVTP